MASSSSYALGSCSKSEVVKEKQQRLGIPALERVRQRQGTLVPSPLNAQQAYTCTTLTKMLASVKADSGL